jgi:hypothetical protein
MTDVQVSNARRIGFTALAVVAFSVVALRGYESNRDLAPKLGSRAGRIMVMRLLALVLLCIPFPSSCASPPKEPEAPSSRTVPSYFDVLRGFVGRQCTVSLGSGMVSIGIIHDKQTDLGGHVPYTIKAVGHDFIGVIRKESGYERVFPLATVRLQFNSR